MSRCQRTFGTTQEWCLTSEEGIEAPPSTNVLVLIPNAKPSPGVDPGQLDEAPCGFYSSTRQAYWDFACTNTTGAARQLTTAYDVWSTITTAAIVTTVTLYAVAGAWAAAGITSRIRAPVAGIGVCVGLVVYGGAVGGIVALSLAFPLAQVYLAMPYALSADAAVMLGISLGCTMAYVQMGQQVEAVRPPV